MTNLLRSMSQRVQMHTHTYINGREIGIILLICLFVCAVVENINHITYNEFMHFIKNF